MIIQDVPFCTVNWNVIVFILVEVKFLDMENYIGKKIAATHIPLIINPDSGFLFFDEKSIVFTTTLGASTIKIDYCDISEVLKKRALLGIISCFWILTHHGEKYKFIVFNRKAVVEFLKSKIETKYFRHRGSLFFKKKINIL
ncbi:hypothetical protein [Clostridium minihomine]|uniref:hypothetical protein n=1 Tax=Clostridium minihomine TaxID=2045012 RepID=UPI000C75BD7E|nr:hypothetical protein [Clostridium minihomine]